MLEGALDLVCMGIAVTRTSGEIMYANEYCRKLLGDYSLAETTLDPQEQIGQPHLHGSLAQVVRNLGGVRQVWSSTHGHLLVEILPLHAERKVLNLLGRRGGAMLMMRERGKHQFPVLEHLMDLFGLTAAEARTCLMLCQVESAEKCAKQLNLSLATVRSQLQAAMNKTATSRQAELLSLILSIPVCRPDNEQTF